MLLSISGMLSNVALGAESATAPPNTSRSTATALDAVLVTAARIALIGEASTASEGVVVREELALSPVYRPAELLEMVPGLVVTSHSGEGKANQYLLRGYNLDHGTDLASFVEGMPVNEPTHAHGQGYTDLNFLIPELVTLLRYTKGPFHAEEGDFSSVGALHVSYPDALDDQLQATAGTYGFERVVALGSERVGPGNLLGAFEVARYDGPWVSPDDLHKTNGVLRYAGGNAGSGFSLLAAFYQARWNSTTDQPQRAVREGLITRWGSLDPSDGGQAQRWSLSGQLHAALAGEPPGGIADVHAHPLEGRSLRITVSRTFGHGERTVGE